MWPLFRPCVLSAAKTFTFTNYFPSPFLLFAFMKGKEDKKRGGGQPAPLRQFSRGDVKGSTSPSQNTKISQFSKKERGNVYYRRTLAFLFRFAHPLFWLLQTQRAGREKTHLKIFLNRTIKNTKQPTITTYSSRTPHERHATSPCEIPLGSTLDNSDTYAPWRAKSARRTARVVRANAATCGRSHGECSPQTLV